MAEKTEKRNPIVSLIGGIIMTLILVVAVPVIISYYIEPYILDFIGDTDLDLIIVQLSSGTIGAIVMFIVLVLFMVIFGGGAILRKFGVIGIIGLILAYWLLLDDPYGWIVPVIIVVLLGLLSYARDKKKSKA